MANGTGGETLKTQIEDVIGRTDTALQAIEGWLGIIEGGSAPEEFTPQFDAN